MSRKGGDDTLESKDFVPIYEEIARVIGEEKTVKLYEMLRGQQITFPQRLYNTSYVTNYVKENYNGKNIRELARKFDYSERRVREFLKS
jgi:Mor family transcriptional regulator